MTVTNTLAYSNTELITTVKSFMKQSRLPLKFCHFEYFRVDRTRESSTTLSFEKKKRFKVYVILFFGLASRRLISTRRRRYCRHRRRSTSRRTKMNRGT